jgi:N utilization substance protein A
MSQELIAIIEQMEREKGIKKEVLIQAVESALLSAVRKVIDVKPNEALRVELDRQTGEFHTFRNETEIKTIDFGRIAASTARQVIIQKIREAEKEVIFCEFQDKVGEIVSGTVYRFEKDSIIVDLLGKAEGVISRREQSSAEQFKQGQRIRAYVAEVKKETKGPQIVLSRTHSNLIKKFFELEVPEIYEGIVEIKAIARQPGERTKIAVWSKNDKVDSVGACVGMRGNRVRNIVNELQGEKIDIVRYSDDIREYIKAALSPAAIAEIRLDKEHMKAEVIVEDDQLSLAIGKHGQNVRLASKLLGWELDIRTKTTAAAAVAQREAEQAAIASAGQEVAPLPEKPKRAKKAKSEAKEKPAKVKKAAEAQKMTIEDIDGIGEKTVAALADAGFKTIRDVADADIAKLVEVKGIGQKKAEKIILLAKALLK